MANKYIPFIDHPSHCVVKGLTKSYEPCCAEPPKTDRTVGHNKLYGSQQKLIKEMGIPDLLTCLLRSFYSG